MGSPGLADFQAFILTGLCERMRAREKEREREGGKRGGGRSDSELNEIGISHRRNLIREQTGEPIARARICFSSVCDDRVPASRTNEISEDRNQQDRSRHGHFRSTDTDVNGDCGRGCVRERSENISVSLAHACAHAAERSRTMGAGREEGRGGTVGNGQIY